MLSEFSSGFAIKAAGGGDKFEDGAKQAFGFPVIDASKNHGLFVQRVGFSFHPGHGSASGSIACKREGFLEIAEGCSIAFPSQCALSF